MEIWNDAIAVIQFTRLMCPTEGQVTHYKQNMKVITINIKAHHGTWPWTSFINFPSLKLNSIGSTFCIYYMVRRFHHSKWVFMFLLSPSPRCMSSQSCPLHFITLNNRRLCAHISVFLAMQFQNFSHHPIQIYPVIFFSTESKHTVCMLIRAALWTVMLCSLVLMLCRILLALSSG
jgi:hypothetical protein